MTLLSVNLNKVALLRNARNGEVPSVGYQRGSQTMACGS